MILRPDRSIFWLNDSMIWTDSLTELIHRQIPKS